MPDASIDVVGNLVMVFAQRGDPAQLVFGAGIEEQRSKSARAAVLIVDHWRDRRRQAELGAVAVHAGVVGEALGVAADVELIVGGIEISGGENQVGLIVALESGGRDHVEETVSAVAILARISAALDLQFLHVFRD